MNKKYIKDFLIIQKNFYLEVMNDYLAPFKSKLVLNGMKDCFAPLKSMYIFIKLLFGVVIEIPRQMFICFVLDNDEYKKLQDYKLKEEVEEMSKSGASIEEIEVELDK